MGGARVERGVGGGGGGGGGGTEKKTEIIKERSS